MDRDTSSIGGIEKPLQPTNQLFVFTVIMDVLAIGLSFIISPITALYIFIYIVFSRLYSYRKIRLKKFPIIGYLVVILNQGGLVFYAIYSSVNNINEHAPITGIICSILLIGGFYPITQIYQHKADANDKVKTISMLLGIKGTFIFCSIIYAVAFGLLFQYFLSEGMLYKFFILLIFFIPVIIYFTVWFLHVNRDESKADYNHTMKMNKLASTCTNLAFITLLIINQF